MTVTSGGIDVCDLMPRLLQNHVRHALSNDKGGANQIHIQVLVEPSKIISFEVAKAVAFMKLQGLSVAHQRWFNLDHYVIPIVAARSTIGRLIGLVCSLLGYGETMMGARREDCVR